MTEGNHVLYLFGAGASAKAIPVVHGLPGDMKKIADRLKEWGLNIPQVSPEIIERAEIICTDLHELADTINEVEKSQGIKCTVDDYMSHLEKKPYGQAKYQKSKSTLATYFLLKQFFNTDKPIQLDERYGDWLRNIVPDRKQEKFANNIRCLTWNYDMQMELAYYQYFPKESPVTPCEIINAFSYPQPFRKVANPSQLGIHLNGIVLPTKNLQFTEDEPLYKHFVGVIAELFHTTDGQNHAKNKFSPSGWGSKFLKKLLDISQHYTLQFHWDRHTYNPYGMDPVFDRTELEKAIVEHKILENAACVVVVGYSFPGCNGNMDRKILRSLKNRPVKIYIQDPEAKAVRERIIQQFEWPEEYQNRIIPITGTSSFFIPDMLIPEN